MDLLFSGFPKQVVHQGVNDEEKLVFLADMFGNFGKESTSQPAMGGCGVRSECFFFSYKCKRCCIYLLWERGMHLSVGGSMPLLSSEL